jgi:hypothetical protein
MRDIVQRIEANASPVDFLSEEFPFTETQYYNEEMGEGLIRRYVSAEKLIDPDQLPHWKHLTNLWEDQHSVDGCRAINIDPGYLTAANLVLASTKPFSHRLYLGRGIYGEVTMLYMHGEYIKLPWTYPDYLNHQDAIKQIRHLYMAQRKSMT